jgi:hypothetical protein
MRGVANQKHHNTARTAACQSVPFNNYVGHAAKRDEANNGGKLTGCIAVLTRNSVAVGNAKLVDERPPREPSRFDLFCGAGGASMGLHLEGAVNEDEAA